MTRDIPVAAALVGCGLPTVLEIHQAPERWSLRLLRRIAAAPSMRLVVTMTAALRDRLLARGVNLPRTLVLHDGVDVDRFAAAPTDLSWRDGRPTVLYTGHLFPEKGVSTLVDAARHLPGIAVRIVGGMPAHIGEWRRRLAADGPSNVEFLGYYPPERIPAIQKGADLLVLPNSGRHPHSARDTSPMKLFEYMAAGRPIVSSDVPALREVLTHDVNAWLVPADEPAALAGGIRTLLGDAALASRLADQAHLDVRRYRWTGRADAIIHGAGLESPAELPGDAC
jgi:glycosyltransferase involved in cell wall biosynthesis